MNKRTIRVFVWEDPYLTDVIVQAVTKSGQFIHKSMARWLVVSGDVEVDGNVEVRPDTILFPGVYNLRVGPSVYRISLEHSGKE